MLDSRPVKAVRLFFVLVALPMFLVFPYNQATNNPNENVRTYMTMSIVENHTFCIDKVLTNGAWRPDGLAVVVRGYTAQRHHSWWVWWLWWVSLRRLPQNCADNCRRNFRASEETNPPKPPNPRRRSGSAPIGSRTG